MNSVYFQTRFIIKSVNFQVGDKIHSLLMFLLNDTTRDLSVIMIDKNNDERKRAAKEVTTVLHELMDEISRIQVVLLPDHVFNM